MPLDEVYNHTGFRTAFAFDDELAALVKETGNTQVLRGQSVYADTLFVDFDSSDGSDLIAYLQSQGIAFERWHSGGRSIHLHIPLVPIVGNWVPMACKEWQQAHTDKSDVSFLHAAGMYRLPNTYHWRHAGRSKQLLDTTPGKPLELSLPSKPIFVASGDASPSKFFQKCLVPQHEGNRAPYIWQLGSLAAEAGIEFDEALKHIRWWNAKYATPPRDDPTLVSQVQSAYRRTSRKP